MNVLTKFDERISAIFEEGAPGQKQPFSFKRLAKRAVREMEDETFVIDGVDTAPALYTVLVSAANDELMRPLYIRITNEISLLIESQAKRRGYTFVGQPLVRFMVDPALRSGRFSVFAENIDPRTLARLRDEENAYLGITPPREAYAPQSFVPNAVPVHEEEPAPIAQEVAFEAEPAADPAHPFGADVAEPFAPEPQELFAEEEPAAGAEEPDPFQIIPEDYVASVAEAAAQDADQAQHASHFAASAPEPEPTDGPDLESANVPDLEAVPAPASVPDLAPAAPEPAAPAPAPAAPEPPAEPACTLVDLGSGRTYRITAERASIGRERVAGGVVLTDPNASRRHAELAFNGSSWSVRDLNSTNGTLVNDMDVNEARLHDGDVLTIGLTNLEFRAG